MEEEENSEDLNKDLDDFDKEVDVLLSQIQEKISNNKNIKYYINFFSFYRFKEGFFTS